MSDHDRVWFLAQLKPNSYRIAERNLARQGFQTFLPLHEEATRSGSRFTVQTRPLFPGYLFVALDTLQGRWRAVNSTYGITRLVSLGKEPTPVPAGLVDQLMMRCNEQGVVLPSKLLKKGDRVKMAKGPFADLIATIESVTPDRRVWVLLDIMGGQTRVAVQPDQLRAV
ncbi:transcription termination/antitermination protein NusG [Martelella sp. FOR1707]